MPAAQDAAHRGRDLFRRGPVCRGLAARHAREVSWPEASPRHGEEHELHRPRGRGSLGDRGDAAPADRRRPLFPPTAFGRSRYLAEDRVHNPARRGSHLRTRSPRRSVGFSNGSTRKSARPARREFSASAGRRRRTPRAPTMLRASKTSERERAGMRRNQDRRRPDIPPFGAVRSIFQRIQFHAIP